MSEVINWCRSMLPWAMNAEYCMWWAQRLWWWGRYCDSPWLIFMGLLCSRAALAEVCRMAGVVLHELCHKQQNSAFNAHCKALAKNECSAFWWEREFLNRMMARLGLPHPKSKVGSAQFNALELKGDPPFHYDDVPSEDGCADFVLKTTHCNIAARAHFARLRTIVPGKCTTQKQDLVRLVELNQGANLCS